MGDRIFFDLAMCAGVAVAGTGVSECAIGSVCLNPGGIGWTQIKEKKKKLDNIFCLWKSNCDVEWDFEWILFAGLDVNRNKNSLVGTR